MGSPAKTNNVPFGIPVRLTMTAPKITFAKVASALKYVENLSTVKHHLMITPGGVKPRSLAPAFMMANA